jgi:plastocyanin domain-containing protein
MRPAAGPPENFSRVECFDYVCATIAVTDMESHVNTENKENRGLYWLIALVSLVACIGLIIVSPEWFWLTLPFLFTFLVKALGMM